MIYSTIVPHEIVWDGFTALENRQYKEIAVGHMTMIVEPVSATQAKIVRLISPNPYDYTNPNYLPGTLIEYQPVIQSNSYLP